MSGGVDSSVAAALLADQGHQVVGATMKLWGGESDSGCCSVSDVEDARRVAAQLGIDHHVFNFTGEFDTHVVAPYVEAHRQALTPNPCIECNRHIKFDRFLNRALRLGFDAMATGHHARVVYDGAREDGSAGHHARADQAAGGWHLLRGADPAKDQSYVLSMLGQEQLSHLLLPVGTMTKEDVRCIAAQRGLRTASKPDSQDVCFITSQAGREGFLRERIPFTPGRLVDATSGDEVGTVEALELVTVGQRRGIGHGPGGERRYVSRIDRVQRIARVGTDRDLLDHRIGLRTLAWTDRPLAGGTPVEAQVSAHGVPLAAVFEADGPSICFTEPQRRVAPGQTVAFYQGDRVLGSGIATGKE